MKKSFFNVIKFVTTLKKSGMDDWQIVDALKTWALESNGKLIEIDAFGHHWIKDSGFLSNVAWEDEIDFDF